MQFDMNVKWKLNGRKESSIVRGQLGRVWFCSFCWNMQRSLQKQDGSHTQSPGPRLRHRNPMVCSVPIPFFPPSYCWPRATSAPGAPHSVLSWSQIQNHHGWGAWVCPCRAADCKSPPWLSAGSTVPMRKGREDINNANSGEDTHTGSPAVWKIPRRPQMTKNFSSGFS